MVAKSPIGTDTKKMRRQLIGARIPPRISPRNEPLKAAAWLTPRAMPRWFSGKASVRMAAELAMSMARADALEDAHDDQVHPGGVAGQPAHAQGEREEGEDGEAQVVHADPSVHVAQPAQRHHEHAGGDEEAQDHPEQVEALARLQRVDADAPEDVGQRNEDDGPVDRGHEHAQGGDEQGRPLVVVGQRRRSGRGGATRRVGPRPHQPGGSGRPRRPVSGRAAAAGETFDDATLPAAADRRPLALQRPSAAPSGLRGSDGPEDVRRPVDRVTAMIWAQPTAVGSKARMARTWWPAPASRPSHPGGASASASTVRSSPHHRRNGPAAGASRVRRGRRRPAPGPGRPAACRASELDDDLRLSVAAHGADEVRRAPRPPRSPASGRGCGAAGGPGPTSAGWPSTSEKPTPRLCRKMPVDGSNRCEPKSERVGLGQRHPEPVPVDGAQVRRLPVPDPGDRTARPSRRPWSTSGGGGAAAEMRAAAAARRAGSRSAAPSAPSKSTSGRSWPTARHDSTSRWAQRRVVGIGAQAGRLGHRGAGQGQVALRGRGHRPQLMAPGAGAQRGRTTRPRGVSKSPGAKCPAPRSKRPRPNSPP